QERAFRQTSYFFFQAEDGIRDPLVTGVQTCALPISGPDLRGKAELPPGPEVGFPVEPKPEPKVGKAGILGFKDKFASLAQDTVEIGRASCRERVWMSGMEVARETE